MLTEEEKIIRVKEIQSRYLEELKRIEKIRDDKIKIIKENSKKKEVEKLLNDLKNNYE